MKKLSQSLIYQDQWVKLYQDQVEFKSGKIGTYGWVDRKPGVVVAVINSQRRILLSKEFRYVIQAESWELPGGGIDDGEIPAQAAVREVYEETGMAITDVKQIGQFFPVSSFSQELITVFSAKTNSTDIHQRQTEEGELIFDSQFFTMSEALALIDAGSISDAMTATVIQMVARL